MTPAQLLKQYGTVQSVALVLGVTRQTVYNWLRAGKIPARMLPYVMQKVDVK